MENDVNLAYAVQLGKEISGPKTAGNMVYALVPDGHTITNITGEAHAEKPLHRRKGTVKVFDANSFVNYFNDFADGWSRIFADPTALCVTGILDYHQDGENGGPRHAEHRAVYPMPKSQEWTIWGGSNSKGMSQADFAQFIEDNAADIVSPDPATMIEVSRDLSAKSDVTFASSIRLENGQHQLVYQEEIRGTVGKGNLQVPSQFSISIPIFLNGERYEIMARLRYRIKEGKLVLWYELYRVQCLVDSAFMSVLAGIEAATDRVIIVGTVG